MPDLGKLLERDIAESGRSKEGVYPPAMSFSEFLSFVTEHPEVARTAHQRLYDSIMVRGVKSVAEGLEDPRLKKIFERLGLHKLRLYNAFSDFFGVEEPIHQFMNALLIAATSHEEADIVPRSMLYLKGPVGTGKSSFAERLRSLMDGITFYTLAIPLEEGEDYNPEALVVVSSDDGSRIRYAACPMNCNPLYALPRHLRMSRRLEDALREGHIEKELYEAMTELLGKIKLYESGNICIVCQERLRQLDNDYTRFAVVRRRFSLHKRIGVAQVAPISDPQAVDVSQLIGSVDTSMMEIYGQDDPRAFRLSGALNVANGGIIEFIEVFKAPDEFLRPLNTATQEKTIPTPGRQQLQFCDVVILAHSNPEDFDAFRASPRNKAMIDRLIPVTFPYNLRLSEEMKIYEKITGGEHRRGGHIAPHTLRVASAFRLLTTYKSHPKAASGIVKMRLYDGEEIVERGETVDLPLSEIMKAGRDAGEGMDGLSTRFITKAIESALAESTRVPPCVLPEDILRALANKVLGEFPPSQERDKWLQLLRDDILKYYHELLKVEFVKFFAEGFDEEAANLFKRYCDHLEAWADKKKTFVDEHGDEIVYDENELRRLEDLAAVGKSAADGFRTTAINTFNRLRRKNATVTWCSHEPLRDAIQKHLMDVFLPTLRALVSSKHLDEGSDEQKKYNRAREIAKTFGYRDCCIPRIFEYMNKNVLKA